MGINEKIKEGWNPNGINGELLEISASEEVPEVENTSTEEQVDPEIDATETDPSKKVDQSEVEEPETDPEDEPAQKRGKLSDEAAGILAKYQVEKRKRKEIERELNQKKLDEDKQKMIQDFVKRGWPQDEAEIMAEDKISQKRDSFKQKQENDDIKAKLDDISIRELANSDPFYSDAVSYSEEIKEKMHDWKCDAETAYMALRGKLRTKEFQREQEQRKFVKKQQPGKKIENASPVAMKQKYQLSDQEKRALAGLQRAQPEANWTAKKYHEMMKE